MTTLEKLEWALMTIRDQLKFGMPEEQAIKARERRIRGVLVDAVKEVKQLEGKLELSLEIIDELTKVAEVHLDDTFEKINRLKAQ